MKIPLAAVLVESGFQHFVMESLGVPIKTTKPVGLFRVRFESNVTQSRVVSVPARVYAVPRTDVGDDRRIVQTCHIVTSKYRIE
jgi:hypothetical protein